MADTYREIQSGSEPFFVRALLNARNADHHPTLFFSRPHRLHHKPKTKEQIQQAKSSVKALVFAIGLLSSVAALEPYEKRQLF